MRRKELDILKKPYQSTTDDRPSGLVRALGVDIPSWSQLETSVTGDLATSKPFGIQWWAPHPDFRRRILISDYLVTCIRSASDNLIEAALHWFEYLDYAEQDSDFIANCVSLDGGVPVFRYRQSESPMDDARVHLIGLHAAGCVRALVGALDCLGAVIIGVVALKASIMKASFGDVRNILREIAQRESMKRGIRIQREFALQFEQIVLSEGPAGWIEWMVSFRNMLVHRGRRFDSGTIVPREEVILGPDGNRIPRARRVTMLPFHPAYSDVEVLVWPDATLVLTESAEVTLRGLLASTKCLLERTGYALLAAWNARKETPVALIQPIQQWPELRLKPSEVGFSGYRPATVPYDQSMLHVHPHVSLRLSSAALLDDRRHLWACQDEEESRLPK